MKNHLTNELHPLKKVHRKIILFSDGSKKNLGFLSITLLFICISLEYTAAAESNFQIFIMYIKPQKVVQQSLFFGLADTLNPNHSLFRLVNKIN
jgi:hypothetical protein